MKKKLPLIIAFVVAITAIVCTVVFLVTKLSGDEEIDDMEHTDKNDVTNIVETDNGKGPDVDQNFDNNTDNINTDEFDIKKYFEDRAEIISVIPVKDSTNTKSEKQVIQDLKERGFIEYPVNSRYTIDGELRNDITISESSSDKHPIYETYYVTSKNELWVITSIDGTVSAYPSSYNLSHENQVPIEISESEKIASYDCFTNSIYITKPKQSVLDVHVVERIDAETIESINLEAR